MLIGAHVSTAGGLRNAVERGTALGCDSIQIFNQSPRMWRPTNYGEDDYAAFREAMEASEISSVIIHAVYLINPASSEREMRRKSLTSLVHALRIGDGIGADGVVVHPGALKGGRRPAGVKRSARFLQQAVGETESCPLLIEHMAGTGVLGADFDEIGELIELTGEGGRMGACLDSCHLFASGYDVRSPELMSELVDEFDSAIGLKRLKALHINDSRDELGSLRDRHANIGAGQIGAGMAAFLSEPRFEGLPAALEVPGPDKHGPDKSQVKKARQLRARGLKAR
ncbi:MAG: deoxyribonuclease IV [Solirubrobacterales bacterium]